MSTKPVQTVENNSSFRPNYCYLAIDASIGSCYCQSVCCSIFSIQNSFGSDETIFDANRKEITRYVVSYWTVIPKISVDSLCLKGKLYLKNELYFREELLTYFLIRELLSFLLSSSEIQALSSENNNNILIFIHNEKHFSESSLL